MCLKHTFDKELRDPNQSKDVHVEHRLIVVISNLTNLFNTEHKASIVHCSPGSAHGNIAEQDNTHRGRRFA